MPNDKKSIRVTIYGAEYPIRGNASVEYIQKVAEFVDLKMREVEQELPFKSTAKVAILAALNITDELFREKDAREKVLREYDQRIQALIDTIDRNL